MVVTSRPLARHFDARVPKVAPDRFTRINPPRPNSAFKPPDLATVISRGWISYAVVTPINQGI
jgi:hypothetical protein